MTFSPGDLSQDKFLGGKLKIWQPKHGHRAGIDPVLLAASVPALPGQAILELGCGSGIASLCVARRVAGLDLMGIELQCDYAELARINADENGVAMKIFVGDIAEMPPELLALNFDHVIANPPYYLRSRGSSAQNEGRDKALAGDTPLSTWVDAATKRLRPGGFLSFVQKSDRLQDLMSVLDGRLGGVLVQPLSAREGRDAKLVIVRARKGSRAAMRLLAPIVLHAGLVHERDGDSYVQKVSEILRNGAGLEFS